jgi:hypothetical protein
VLPLGPEVPEKSTVPKVSVMKRALPPVLLAANCVNAPLLVVMVALPAVLVSVNETRVGPTPLLMMAAFPAELVSANVMEPLLVMAALPAVLVPLKKLTPLFC